MQHVGLQSYSPTHGTHPPLEPLCAVAHLPPSGLSVRMLLARQHFAVCFFSPPSSQHLGALCVCYVKEL